MFGQFVLFIVFSLLFACSGSVGDAGRLVPQAADGVTLLKNETAQITADGVTLNVAGSWANQSFQRLTVEIDNKSPKPFSFDYSKVSFQGDTGEKLVLNRVADVTGVDNSDSDPNNDTVKELYSQDAKPAAVLTVAPNERRIINLQFNNFTKPENKLTDGKNVIVSLILNEAGERKIFFNCVGDKNAGSGANAVVLSVTAFRRIGIEIG